ncbi:MAG: hypothetical protein MI741_08325 [Rhodospirillales bacterium]|nr:hypothetical protein [Rhodospirillales bacterium]
MSSVRLAHVDLPDFGMPTAQPEIPAATYEARIAEARRRAAGAGYDVLAVYADREHAANLAFLTGFDPRFEEALLLLADGGDPVLLLGNECFGYADISPVPLTKIRYQSFSLLGQSRAESRPLAEILADAGIRGGSRVGFVGWKYFGAAESDEPAQWIEAPSYLVDVFRETVGDGGTVENATAIFMNPRNGLRAANDVDQLAAFEFAACHTSAAVGKVLFGLRPGFSEFDAVNLMELSGLPQSCHLMLSSGPRAWLGLGSPKLRHIEEGDAFVTAYGLWGALNCRAGFVVSGPDGLPASIRDYFERLVSPYFAAIAEWYETIGIGVSGGTLYEIIERRLGDPFFGISLNPGHLIHLDEWVCSPIFAGSDIPLRSGMALQVDVIPATGTEYFTTNIEDGIALADEELRAELAEKYPQAWQRIDARRRFMAECLGIDLKPEVLPFSNIPAYLPPYLLEPHRVATMARAR